MSVTYRNAKLYTGAEYYPLASFIVENQIFTEIDPNNHSRPTGQVVDLGGQIVTPAFIDLQVYGGQDKLFNNEPTTEAIAATWESVRAGGAAHFQITLSCSPLETMWQAMDACRQYRADGGKGLIGLHLEGPYFNPEKRGAHPLKNILKPEPATIREILKRGAGVVTYMTIAPEMFDPESLEILLNSNLCLSAGHSNATYEQADRAFRLGIGRATHLFNAMSPFQGRAPGMVGAIYDHKPWTSIIADGIHCDFASVRISHQVLGEKLFLISDAVTDSFSGDYRFRFAGDRYVDEAGTLAGSSLTMAKAVQNTIQKAGIAPEEAIRMASSRPAQVIGRANTLGSIAPGYPAEWVLFDSDWNLLEVHV